MPNETGMNRAAFRPPGRWDTRPCCQCLHEVHLGVRRFVVDENVASRAVPSRLNGGAARRVPGRNGWVSVPGCPVRQEAERAGEFLALGGQLVLRPWRPL